MTTTTLLSARIAQWEAAAALEASARQNLQEAQQWVTLAQAELDAAVAARLQLTRVEQALSGILDDATLAAENSRGESAPIVIPADVVAAFTAPPSLAAAQALEDLGVRVDVTEVPAHEEATASQDVTLSPAEDEPGEYVSEKQRVLDLVEAAAPGQELTAEGVAPALGIERRNAANYLGVAFREGLLTREPGTGTPKVPSVYRRSGGGETVEPVQDAPAPAEVPSADPPAEPTPPAPARDLPFLKTDARAPDPAATQVVLGCLRDHGRPMSANMILNRLSRAGMKYDALVKILDHAIRGGQVVHTPERLYALTEAPKVGSA